MKIGIEIETITGRNTHGRAVDAVGERLARLGIDAAAKYDGSLTAGGVEVITRPLARDQVADTVRRIFGALAHFDVFADHSCGLHVHVSPDQGQHAIRNTARRWVNFEDTIDMLVAPHRRGDSCSYARSNVLLFGADPVNATRSPMWEAACNASERDLVRMFCPAGRYYKLNLHSLARHGTMEFRNFHGTICADDVIGWALFAHDFVQVAQNQDRLWRRPNHRAESFSDRVRKMLRDVKPDAARWVRSRV